MLAELYWCLQINKSKIFQKNICLKRLSQIFVKLGRPQKFFLGGSELAQNQNLPARYEYEDQV